MMREDLTFYYHLRQPERSCFSLSYAALAAM